MKTKLKNGTEMDVDESTAVIIYGGLRDMWDSCHVLAWDQESLDRLVDFCRGDLALSDGELRSMKRTLNEIGIELDEVTKNFILSVVKDDEHPYKFQSPFADPDYAEYIEMKLAEAISEAIDARISEESLWR